MNKIRARARLSKKPKKRADEEKERVAGAALLLSFLNKNGVNFRAAAKSVGVKHPAVWQWVHNITIPLERYRSAIEIWTGGKVPASSWLRKAEQKPIDVQPFHSNGTDG